MIWKANNDRGSATVWDHRTQTLGRSTTVHSVKYDWQKLLSSEWVTWRRCHWHSSFPTWPNCMEKLFYLQLGKTGRQLSNSVWCLVFAGFIVYCCCSDVQVGYVSQKEHFLMLHAGTVEKSGKFHSTLKISSSLFFWSPRGFANLLCLNSISTLSSKHQYVLSSVLKMTLFHETTITPREECIYLFQKWKLMALWDFNVKYTGMLETKYTFTDLF